MADELAAHEAELEREAEEERKKNEKAILALNARKEALLKEKKTKAKQEIQRMVNNHLARTTINKHSQHRYKLLSVLYCVDIKHKMTESQMTIQFVSK